MKHGYRYIYNIIHYIYYYFPYSLVFLWMVKLYTFIKLRILVLYSHVSTVVFCRVFRQFVEMLLLCMVTL